MKEKDLFSWVLYWISSNIRIEKIGIQKKILSDIQNILQKILCGPKHGLFKTCEKQSVQLRSSLVDIHCPRLGIISLFFKWPKNVIKTSICKNKPFWFNFVEFTFSGKSWGVCCMVYFASLGGHMFKVLFERRKLIFSVRGNQRKDIFW